MTLPNIGQLMSLEAVAADFRAAVVARGLADPVPFLNWAEQILVDHPERQALVLPAGAATPGDLDLDELAGEAGMVATIAVFGDLKIAGRILNEDTEAGPFLLVTGNLRAGAIHKAAAAIVVLGSILVDGLIFCDTDNGVLAAGGSIEAATLIDNDHEILAGDEISALIVSDDAGNMRAALVADVFEAPEDDEDEWPDGDLIRARLAAGLPVLKG